jgi:23S rRNA (adenine2503-C2)-methyltransferase
MTERLNLLDLDAQGLGEVCEGWGERTFRARQLMRWVHRAAR